MRPVARHPDGRGGNLPLLKNGRLEAGDLILTGTPGGTAVKTPGAGKKLSIMMKVAGRLLTSGRLTNPKEMFIEKERDSGAYLKDGDLIEAEIDRIGSLSNMVKDEV